MMNRETFSKKTIKASVMPVQPGITQVDHGDVPVTVGLARWSPGGTPVSTRCHISVTRH